MSKYFVPITFSNYFHPDKVHVDPHKVNHPEKIIPSDGKWKLR